MKMLRLLRPAAVLAAGLLALTGRAQQGVALTSNNGLISFSVGTVPTAAAVPVTGLASGENIVGIDYRPINRTLVALTSQSRLFVVDPSTGAATLLSTLSLPIAGSSFGIDFNPVPDRLRIVTNTGLNYRVNVDTGGVTVDGPIAYAATDPGAATAVPVQVSGAGYTNAVAGRIAAATSLFVIDVGRGVLCLQNPPNNGTLTTVGPLGVAATGATGFDIFSPNAGYASLVVGGQTGLYRVNLTTGAATLVNALPAGVTDIALQPKEPALAIVNTSARGLVAVGEGALITGFVINGNAPVNVLVVARGPSLTAFGVTNVLSDTFVRLFQGGTLVDSNDDWQTNPRAADITATTFAPSNAKESAVIATLQPGAYTANVSGGGTASTGVAIVEVYELP